MKPIIFSTPMVQAIFDGRKTMTRRVMMPQPNPNSGLIPPLDIRHGQVYEMKPKFCSGDILWVRETWAKTSDNFDLENDLRDGYMYKANGDDEFKWRPSIFMPKGAARLFLRVKTVRVERVQEMTLESARAEGFDSIVGFMTLWNQLNAHRGYGWDANPWVWVIEFERCEKPKEATCAQ